MSPRNRQLIVSKDRTFLRQPIPTQPSDWYWFKNGFLAFVPMNRHEWFSTFCDFRKRALFCRADILLWFQFQKIGEFVRARPAQSFHFFTETIKMKILYFIFKCLIITSKNNRQKNRNKKCFNLFLGLKIGKFIFDLVKGKQISCSRSLNFSF